MVKIKLRALEPSDVNLLYDWENDPSIWTISHNLTPYSKYTLSEFISLSTQDIYTSKQLRLMIDEKESGKTIGIIDIFDFDPFHQRAGIGILIHQSARGNGYAKEALLKVIHYLFNVIHLHQIYCNVMINNIISLQLFQEVGFKICGQKRDWIYDKEGYHDEYTLQLIRPI